MAGCKFCAWFRNQLNQSFCSVLQAKSEAWEQAHSNDAKFWALELDQDRLRQAYEMVGTDPETAFQMCLDLAQKGSVFSMRKVAWAYGSGSGVAADHAKATEWYRRAIKAGSWMATRYYAGFLAKCGNFKDCEAVLNMGIKAEWVPAYFWLAFWREKQSKSRKTYREIKPLLEHAAERGHPWAQHLLSGFMIRGKFGISEIPRGFMLRLADVKAGMAEAQANVHQGRVEPIQAVDPTS